MYVLLDAASPEFLHTHWHLLHASNFPLANTCLVSSSDCWTDRHACVVFQAADQTAEAQAHQKNNQSVETARDANDRPPATTPK